VVALFSIGTVVSQRLASKIDEAADRIVTDFSPSVIALANARAELHRLQDLASDYVDGGGRAEDRARVASSEAEFNRAVGDYERLPFLPGERELWMRVAADITQVHKMLDRTFDAVRRGDYASAHGLVSRDLRAAVDATSADILSNIQLNAEGANEDARMIARRRRESMRAATALALGAAAVTVLVALLVYSLITQHDALQREHASLLQEANAELEIFASRMSHDIMSPLSSTALAIDSVLKHERDEGSRRMLHRGQRGLERATRITRALLEFARSGARPSPTEGADVRAVVSGVVDELRALAEETGARLEASVPGELSVACSEGLLSSAVGNLVRNAITYLDGGPTKRVDVLAADAGERVRIEVRDTGPGLPPGAEAHVFEPYVRGQGAKQPGLGLGLATVKRIVETHGGAVGVESHTGAGCRFWIDLPKAAGGAAHG
jgi:signal transduction histidine kinase